MLVSVFVNAFYRVKNLDLVINVTKVGERKRERERRGEREKSKDIEGQFDKNSFTGFQVPGVEMYSLYQEIDRLYQ